MRRLCGIPVGRVDVCLKKPLPVLPAFPSHYDLDEGFLHVHRQAFPDELGERLQAHYLADHDLTRGTAIPGFVDRFKTDRAELIGRLERLHADANFVELHHGRLPPGSIGSSGAIYDPL